MSTQTAGTAHGSRHAWQQPVDELLVDLASGRDGLTPADSTRRLDEWARTSFRTRRGQAPRRSRCASPPVR